MHNKNRGFKTIIFIISDQPHRSKPKEILKVKLKFGIDKFSQTRYNLQCGEFPQVGWKNYAPHPTLYTCSKHLIQRWKLFTQT